MVMDEVMHIEKYGKKSILAGMMTARAFALNELEISELEANKRNFDFGHG